MQIMVRDNNVEQALRALKKKLQREGVYREMKLRRHYEKPSEKRAREKAAAVRAVHPGDVRDIPGHRLKGLNPRGVENLLAKSHDHEAGRFLNWMQREVVRPWEKKRGL
jgi:small subunit ribosomal protein S21